MHPMLFPPTVVGLVTSADIRLFRSLTVMP
jgi:hypothetical protein